MTGTPSSHSAHRKPASTMRALGRRNKWATYFFLIVTIAAFAAAWRFGYVTFN